MLFADEELQFKDVVCLKLPNELKVGVRFEVGVCKETKGERNHRKEKKICPICLEIVSFLKTTSSELEKRGFRSFDG